MFSVRVVVAGAGAFGLITAAHLARLGARVMVCDPAALGDNASGVAAGMLAPGQETALDTTQAGRHALLAEARNRWIAHAAHLGLELDRRGALLLGDPEQLAVWRDRLQAAGAPFQAMTAAMVRALVPDLAQAGPGLRLPGDWRLDPAAALSAARRALERNGGRLAPLAVRSWDGRQARLSDGTTLDADRLIVATGAAGELTQAAPELAVLAPIKGQIIRLSGRPLAFPMLRTAELYLCSTDDGAVAGATMEAGRADRRVDPAVCDQLRAKAEALLPALAGARMKGFAGVRAATPDALPLVGPVGVKGVLLAAGARRNGWLLAPLVAEMIAAYLADDDPGPSAALLDAGRFAAAGQNGEDA